MPPKNTDPNKPKGRTSAYAFFVKEQRAQYREEGKKVVFATFAKECSEIWKKIKPGEKEIYDERALVDKDRYTQEMSEYVPAHKSKRSRGGRGRKRKDPNAPKRPLSAFLYFCQEKRPAVKEKNPKFQIGDIAKELGKKWKVIDDAEKEQFERQAQDDRARYEEDKKNYVPPEDDDEEEDEEDDYED